LETTQLKGRCEPHDGGVDVRLEGNADLPGQEALRTFVLSVHSQAQSSRAGQVQVFLTGLKFMSSSNFKVLITWLTQVRELAEGSRYRVRFVSDPAQHWQRRSLQALAAFGGDLVEVVG
jgi:hypothetical protein